MNDYEKWLDEIRGDNDGITSKGYSQPYEPKRPQRSIQPPLAQPKADKPYDVGQKR